MEFVGDSVFESGIVFFALLLFSFSGALVFVFLLFFTKIVMKPILAL